jgi:hypothetical protein
MVAQTSTLVVTCSPTHTSDAKKIEFVASLLGDGGAISTVVRIVTPAAMSLPACEITANSIMAATAQPCWVASAPLIKSLDVLNSLATAQAGEGGKNRTVLFFL